MSNLLLTSAFLCLVASPGNASNTDDILGVWQKRQEQLPVAAMGIEFERFLDSGATSAMGEPHNDGTTPVPSQPVTQKYRWRIELSGDRARCEADRLIWSRPKHRFVKTKTTIVCDGDVTRALDELESQDYAPLRGTVSKGCLLWKFTPDLLPLQLFLRPDAIGWLTPTKLRSITNTGGSATVGDNHCTEWRIASDTNNTRIVSGIETAFWIGDDDRLIHRIDRKRGDDITTQIDLQYGESKGSQMLTGWVESEYSFDESHQLLSRTIAKIVDADYKSDIADNRFELPFPRLAYVSEIGPPKHVYVIDRKGRHIEIESIAQYSTALSRSGTSNKRIAMMIITCVVFLCCAATWVAKRVKPQSVDDPHL